MAETESSAAGQDPATRRFRAARRVRTRIILVIGVVLSTSLAMLQQVRNLDRLDQHFEREIEQLLDRLDDRLRRYELGLKGLASVIAAATPEAVARAHFERFRAARDLAGDFPGALAIGYAERVPPDAEAAFVARAREEYGPNFAIREIEARADQRFILRFGHNTLDPLTEPPPGVGLDLASQADRRQAAIDAARSGQARLSAPLNLVASDQRLTGAIMMFPVYATPGASNPPQDRLASTAGWAVTALLLDDILDSVTAGHDGLAVSIRDSAAQATGAPYFQSQRYRSADAGARHAGLEIDVYGRHWIVDAVALPALRGQLTLTPPWLWLATGLALTLLAVKLAEQLLAVELRREQGLIERDALTRGLLDASPQAIFVVTSDGRIVRANRRVMDLFGLDPHSAHGRTIQELIPALGDPEALMREVGHARTRVLNLSAVGASDTRLHTRVHLSPIQLGHVRHIAIGVLDITAEVEAQRSTLNSERRWRELANSMPQLVWTTDENGVTNFLSEQWMAYTGSTPTEPLVEIAWRAIHPEDAENVALLWQMAVDTRSTFRAEMRIRRYDGVYRWFDGQAVPQFDEHWRVVRWVGSNSDIEDRKRAEEGMRELNATLEERIRERTAALDAAHRDLGNIVNALPSMVGYWGADHRNRFANRAHAEWLGLDPSALPGSPLSVLYDAARLAQLLPYVERALSGEEVTFERDVQASDGGVRRALTHLVPDRTEHGVRGFYMLDYDVTEIRGAQEAAEAANQAKSAFLANMSHEIRTPMNAVINLLYLLEQSELDDEQRDKVGKINLAARSLLGIINDVLDLSKIEAGEMPIARETFDLRQLVGDSAQMMGSMAENKGLRLSVRYGEDVPDLVHGDPMRITQMLNNLLSNAIKFTAHGGVSIRVSSRGSGILRLAVEDTGIGIPPDVLATLFRPFAQADVSVSRQFGGTGLGLALVRRLAEMMNGSVGVESEPDEGSTFWFELPLPAAIDGVLAGGGPRELECLIVDDDGQQLAILTRISEDLGWRVEAVGSGAEALERYHQRAASPRPFDLIIVDWKMPEMDGTEVIRQLRAASAAAQSDTTAVIVSAFDIEPLLEIHSAELADAILRKPITTSRLFDAIHEVFARRQRRRQTARQAAEAVRDRASGPRLAGVRLLLVDDSSINLEVGQRILEREGAQVTTASNGRIAIDLLRAQPAAYDLVLLDIQMPVLDGYGASRAIRAELGLTRLPVIALTAGALVSERERALAAGMDDFISKPFDPEALMRLVAAHVARRRADEAAAPTPAQDAPSDADSPWPDIEGIDAEESRRRLAGDPELLRLVLQRIIGEHQDPGVWHDPGDDAQARQALAVRAHKLVGTAGAIGAPRAHALASRLQALLRTDAPAAAEPLGPLLSDIRDELARLVASARRYVEAQSSG